MLTCRSRGTLAAIVCTTVLIAAHACKRRLEAEVDAAAAFERLEGAAGHVGSAGQERSESHDDLRADGRRHRADRTLQQPGTAGRRPHGHAPIISMARRSSSRTTASRRTSRRSRPTASTPRPARSSSSSCAAPTCPTENAGHMRRALYRIDDANHFTTSWEFFQDGKKTMTELETFTRVWKA